MKSQFIVSRLKVSLVTVGVFSLFTTPFQSKADEVEYLYTEDGNVQVSKVVRNNMLGGASG